MEPDAVVRLRLQAQMLRGPGAGSPGAALRRLLAVQAQEFPYARWSLAQRVSSTGRAPVTAADIEQAVADGTVLRTHILRPTWHFVHREDLRWLSALSAPRLHRLNALTYRRTGIDGATARRTGDVLAGAVADGNHLTRGQLADKLHAAGFEASGLRLAYIIMHAEVSGILASGTPVRSRGGALKQTYALFDERVPSGPQPAPATEEALAELAYRYFTSRGPATAKDCAGWSGLTVTDVRKGVRLASEARPEALASTVIDGVEHYFAAGSAAGTHAAGTPAPGPRIDLVQCYDEYIMGYFATRHYMGGGAPAFPLAGEPIHVVLQDGRMAGSWRHRLLPDRCELDIRLHGSAAGTPGSPLAAAIQEAVDRYAVFTGLPAIRVPSGTKLEGHT